MLNSRQIIGLALLPALFVLSFAFRDQFFFSADTTELFYVINRWYQKAIAGGHFPIWNPHLFGGVYQLGSPPLGIWSPLSFPFYWLSSSYWAMHLALAASLSVAFTGMYFLGNEVTNDRTVAVFMAFGYAFSGMMLSTFDRSATLMGNAVLPWGLYAYFLLKRAGHGSAIIGFGFALSLLFLHGEWPGAVVLAGFAILHSLIPVAEETRGRYIRHLISTMVAIAFGFLLSCVQLIPVFENLALTERGTGWTFEQASFFSLHPLRIFQILIPGLWGQLFDGTFWGASVANGIYTPRFWFHSLYLSPVILLGLFFAVRSLLRAARGEQRQWALLFCAIFLIFVSFGSHFPLHRLMFDTLPLYPSLRFPEKWFFLSLVLLFPIAGWGLTIWKESAKEKFPAQLLLFFGLFEVAAALASALLGLLQTNVVGSATQTLFNESAGIHAALGIVLLAFRFSPKLQRGFLLSPAFQQALPISIFVAGLLLHAPAQPVYPLKAFETSSGLDKHLDQTRRIVRDGAIRSGPNLARQTLESNWTMHEGFDQVFGYDSVMPNRVIAFSNRELFINLPQWSRVLALGDIVSSVRPRNPELKKWFESGFLNPTYGDKDRNLVVLKVKNPTPRFSLASTVTTVNSEEQALELVRSRGESEKPLIIERHEAYLAVKKHEVDFTAIKEPPPEAPAIALTETTSSNTDIRNFEIAGGLPSTHLLVLRQGFHPAWRAYADGKEVPTMRADYYNIAALLPAGTKSISFKFQPPGVRIGFWISMVALLVGLAVVANDLRNRRSL